MPKRFWAAACRAVVFTGWQRGKTATKRKENSVFSKFSYWLPGKTGWLRGQPRTLFSPAGAGERKTGNGAEGMGVTTGTI